MFSGTKNKWLVLVAVAALAAFVIACGTDGTKLVSDGSNDGSGGVGAQPTQSPDDGDGDDTQGDPPPVDPGFEVVEVLAPIESVQILVLESYPEQFVVQIISGLPGGCASFSHTDVTQDGTNINIAAYNTVPAPDSLIACTAIYGIHDENVALGSDFERGTIYTVYVNDQPGTTFETGSSPIQVDPPYADPGFVIDPAPVEQLEIIIGEDSRGPVTYYASLVIGLSNGCKEIIEPNVVQSGRSVFDIYPVVKVPTGDVACTDDYRLDSIQVALGVVGEDLVSCAAYTVNAGSKSTTFQAIAPNVRCADPNAPTPTPEPPAGGGSIIADSQALEITLKSQGAQVTYVGLNKVSEQFGLEPTELKVNGQRVLVYEFAPGTSAQKASETVSADGTSFEVGDGSVTSVNWISTPHFYLFGNAIVFYLGDEAEMGRLLDSVGDQFAGGGYDLTDDGENADEFTTREATIEKVTLASTRSIPAQHLIGVTILLSNGCEQFNSIDWSVEGREVHIDVLTQVPSAPVPCTLSIAYEEQSINIGSDFEAGVEYDVFVNGDRQGSFFGG
jgi:hypothetical protein